MSTAAERHVRRIRGAVVLSDLACRELLGVLDDPDVVAALSPLGSTAAATVGRAGRAVTAGTHADVGKVASGEDGSPDSGHDHWIDTTAAAELLGCSPWNVADLARRGQIPGRCVGRRWSVRRDVIESRARSRRG